MRLGVHIASTMAEKNKDKNWGNAPLDPFNLRHATLSYWERMLQHPDKLTEAQFTYIKKYLDLWDNSLKKATGQKAPDLIFPEKGDKRFKSEAWTQNVVFDFIKQAYLMTSDWTIRMVEENASELDPKTARKLAFFTRQYIDALSPSNFAMTNPDVVEATLESGGENLVRGLQNLLDDLQRGHMLPATRMTDEKAFKLGENIATTPGSVVFRNELMELIQYSPTTPTCHTTPLLIVPPWINKYYILDLKPANSFVKWAVSQGHTVFIISWANPDSRFKDVNFDNYLTDGFLAALTAIEKQTGEKSVNAVGYCIGGTLLTMALAYLEANGKADRVRTATFLTTLIDFDQAGDLKLFVDEEQLDLLTAHMAEKGYLDAEVLKTTFNLLRANDLIWSFVVNNYLMGKEPFPFDLLYWNSDSTNLPAAFHEYYLRRMYLQNDLIKPNALTLAGTPLDVGRIQTPSYFLSTRDDHIAPWRATYAGMQLFAGPKTFTLAASGHIAGVVNPPASQKYCYWSGATTKVKPDQWLDNAKQHEGSWWPNWQAWLKPALGKSIKARTPDTGKLKVLGAAPGTYVTQKAL